MVRLLRGETYDDRPGAYEDALPDVDEGLDELRARLASRDAEPTPLPTAPRDGGARAPAAPSPAPVAPRIDMLLFVSDGGSSRRAIDSTRDLAQRLGAHATLRVIDLAVNPLAPEAERECIGFTPTLLVRTDDGSSARLYGMPDADALRSVLPADIVDLLETG